MPSRAVRALTVVLVLAALTSTTATAHAATSLRLAGTLPEREWRILQAVQTAGLTERLIQIAADTNGHVTVAGLWFIYDEAPVDSTPLIQAYLWDLVQAAFAAVPSLDEIDLTGVQPAETPIEINRMQVVFSAAISHEEFLHALGALSVGERFASLPRVWLLHETSRSSTPGATASPLQPPIAGDIYHGDLSRQAVAMTFDDGPFPIYTTLLLDTLERLGVKATFFLVGQQVRSYPYFARAIVSAGHEVANHTYHHRNLTLLAPPQVLEEIARAQDTITAVTGQVPRYFRPPGGNYNATVLSAVHQLGLVTVFWTANSADYTNLEPRALEGRVLAHLSNGGILLFHQGMNNTIRTLPHMTQILRSRGYAITTVGDVVAARPEPGYRGPAAAAKSMNPRATSVPTNSTPTRSPTSRP